MWMVIHRFVQGDDSLGAYDILLHSGDIQRTR